MKTTIDIPKLTPKELAGLFWEMDDVEQGLFFDELGTLVIATPSPFLREIGSMYGLDWQMYHAFLKATPLGQDAMSRISDNGKRWLKPDATETSERMVAGLTGGVS